MKPPRLRWFAAAFLSLALAQTLPGAGWKMIVSLSADQVGSPADLARLTDEAAQTLRNRIDQAGYTGLVDPIKATRLIRIRVGGFPEDRRQSVHDFILQPGLLEFRLVHPSNTIYLVEGLIPPGYEILHENRVGPDGKRSSIPHLVDKKPVRGLTGRYLKSAAVARAFGTGQPEIHFEFNRDGTRLFAEVTRELQPVKLAERKIVHQLAIILDGKLYSAPIILQPIEQGRGVISGSFDAPQALHLAAMIQNPAPAPLQLIEAQPLDPAAEDQLPRSFFSPRNAWPRILGILLVCFFLAIALIALLTVWASVRKRRNTPLP